MAKEMILGEFDSPASLLKVAKYLASHGHSHFDTYSPFPIHGMDDAMNLKPSKLGWIVLLFGALGLLGGFSMQTFMSLDYKYIISGKPFFSYPAFVPVTFEIMVLFSAFATVFGMFALNKLPQHYHLVFKSSNFRKVTSHGFFVGIESSDPGYDSKELHNLLVSLNSIKVEIIKEDQ